MNFMTFFQAHPILAAMWLMLALMLLLSFGRSAGKTVGCQQLSQLVNREDAVVLDIRPAADYAKGHIVGAINIPLSKLEKADAELERIKSRPIVVVCAQGMTATNACKILKKKGVESIYRLNNGMTAWLGDNLPTSKK